MINKISFGSTFVPSVGLKDGFDVFRVNNYDLKKERQFTKSLDALLSDGKDDVFEISKKAKGKDFEYCVTYVNGKQVSTYMNMLGVLDNEDMVDAVIDLAKNRHPEIDFEKPSSYELDATSNIIKKIKKTVNTYMKNYEYIRKPDEFVSELKKNTSFFQHDLRCANEIRLSQLERQIFDKK